MSTRTEGGDWKFWLWLEGALWWEELWKAEQQQRRSARLKSNRGMNRCCLRCKSYIVYKITWSKWSTHSARGRRNQGWHWQFAQTGSLTTKGKCQQVKKVETESEVWLWLEAKYRTMFNSTQVVLFIQVHSGTLIQAVYNQLFVRICSVKSNRLRFGGGSSGSDFGCRSSSVGSGFGCCRSCWIVSCRLWSE